MDAAHAARRRTLSQAISRIGRGSVTETLARVAPASGRAAWRIGVTGAPGAGKSSLVNRLLPLRIAKLDDKAEIAVVAIDPSSPKTGGALLGDRIRMDAASDDARVFIRSIASGSNNDGLADNVVDLLHEVDAAGFAEIILETVGVGQAEHASSALVDTLVVVLHPDAGDSVQAMKSGLLELADVFAVNKADLPGARATMQELTAVLKHRRPQPSTWLPKVVAVSAASGSGVADLDVALEEHRAWKAARHDPRTARMARRAYHLKSLLARHAAECIDAPDGEALLLEPDVATSYAALIAAIGGALPAPRGVRNAPNGRAEEGAST